MRYSILTDDLDRCIECGRTNVELHEIYYGKNRNNSIKHGMVIPLCKELHHRGNLIGIHQDHELDIKWKKIAQEKFNNDEEFIKIFGRNYNGI